MIGSSISSLFSMGASTLISIVATPAFTLTNSEEMFSFLTFTSTPAFVGSFLKIFVILTGEKSFHSGLKIYLYMIPRFKKKIIKSFIQLWILQAIDITVITKCANWCNSSRNIIGATMQFLVGYNVWLY